MTEAESKTLKHGDIIKTDHGWWDDKWEEPLIILRIPGDYRDIHVKNIRTGEEMEYDIGSPVGEKMKIVKRAKVKINLKSLLKCK